MNNYENQDKVIKASWGHTFEFLLLNSFFLVTYLILLVVLKFGAKIRFDRF